MYVRAGCGACPCQVALSCAAPRLAYVDYGDATDCMRGHPADTEVRGISFGGGGDVVSVRYALHLTRLNRAVT